MLTILFYIVLTVIAFFLLYKAVLAFAKFRQERKYINSLFL